MDPIWIFFRHTISIHGSPSSHQPPLVVEYHASSCGTRFFDKNNKRYELYGPMNSLTGKSGSHTWNDSRLD
jgi:hypothetical protein